MPISLGPPTTNPKWSKRILLLLWILQFCITGFFELITFAVVFFFGAAEGHKHVAWYFTATMIFVFISNFLVLCTILYEFTWAGSLALLTAQRFYRIQLIKSLYILILVILTLVSGSGIPVPQGGRKFAHDWAVVWRLAIFVGPYWTALGYAIKMRQRQAREFADEEESGTLLKLLW